MPTYQYACTNHACGHRFEAVQSFSDPSLTSCPVCESSLRKLFSSVGVVFKGSGFYRTDSRSGANGKSAGEKTSKDAGGSGDAGPAKKDTAAKDGAGSSGSGASASTPKAESSSGKAAVSTT